MLLADETGLILDVIRTAGVTGLLVIAVVAFYKEWVVTGARHERMRHRMETEIEEWKQMALAGTELAERQHEVVDRLSKRAGIK